METKLYFHSEKTDMIENFEEICEENNHVPSNTAVEEAMRVGYEVEIYGDWDLETGKFIATHLMGHKLEKPVEI